MTAPLEVLAAVAGRTMAMSEVDDPVFSAGYVGPGVAIVPDPERGRDAVAPIDGTIVKVHPHAFVVKGDDGRAVLVHLGINTVQLEGEGFTVHRQQGDVVARGDVLITWDPAAVEAGGRSAVCPVVALEAPADALTGTPADGSDVTASDTLFVWG
ncbi:PTS glucose transporter subunit IIA [Sanguibacter sp. HDW7]|uniref:PTS sugar transporter subunit IIA n=1 Tax=Sanguibacter sp. HDW7 TaxID=2714931 RepID=UPI001F0D9360|nr:PTS glucose transporter subunit IIA [Sanguibacter sp. HDW7]